MDTSIFQNLWKRVMPIVAVLMLLLGSPILTGCAEEPRHDITFIPAPTNCYGVVNVCH